MKKPSTEFKIYLFCLLCTIFYSKINAQNDTIGNFVKQDSILNVSYSDQILKTPFGSFDLKTTTGAVYRISGEDLRKTPGDNLSEALRGRVPGLRIIRENNYPGSNNYSYSLNGGTPYILVDGEPRGLEVDLREVEEVLILNDATFNSLLGVFGDNGLIYVITKGGKIQKPVVEVSYQKAFNFPTRMPDLLSANEYTGIINQALTNDGLSPIYSDIAMNAYQSGSDPIRYPNVDYQDEFLRNSSSSDFASVGVFGGKEAVQYSAFVGYTDFNGLEKVGNTINGSNLVFRTKINTKINDFIGAKASVYGRFIENNRPVIDASSMFNLIAGTPANAFPLKVGDTAYVVSNQFNTNLLAELEKGGTRTDYFANMIFDVGFNFNLDRYISDLTYTTYAMLRTYNSQSLQSNSRPGLYTIDYSDNMSDPINLKLYSTEFNNLNVGRQNGDVARNFSYGGNFALRKDLTNGSLNMNLNHLLYYEPTSNSGNPDRRLLVFNLNGSYIWRDKYSFYGNLNSTSSSKYIGSNRTDFFPTVGFAWIASKENFLEKSANLNYLKFRTSYGLIGTEYTATNFFYLTKYRGTGKAYFGAGASTQNQFGYELAQTANDAIDWIVYKQFFLGMDMEMFDRVNFTLNYFNIDISGQINNLSEQYSDALGDNAYLPQLNYTDRKNTGFNSNISYRKDDGDFKYYFGLNAGYNKIIGEKISEFPYKNKYRLQQGKPEDNIIGYVSDGLYTANNIDGAPEQFGEVKVGDIKYVDLNGDNVIDSRDQKAIGNNTPRLIYGINLGAQYKGFNFDIVGMGVSSYDINLSNISYYRHFGLGSYYGSALNNLPNGNANPRLSTIRSINNYKTSDYWLVDGSYFRISNMEIGYTLSANTVEKLPIDNLKLFLRGTNLALFSKMRDLDPEDTTAGINEYPMMQSFVLGTSLNF